MSRLNIDEILRKTLDDRRLTRGERRALSEVLGDHELSDQDYAFLRSRAFDIAKEQLDNPHSKEIVDWLEDVAKILTPKEESSSGVMAESYFSPDDDCPSRIIGLLGGCGRSADICVFTITDNRLAEAIIGAHNRGVKIRIISDNDKAHDLGSDIDVLERSGIDLRVDRSRHHMHHKFALFDDSVLLTGSYNWTRSAALNNEENFVITDNRSLLRAFSKEFEKLWRKFA
jgi:phosphatidylserine/phosphatidylglycerophosphate/cardiolipin synthase-like enzyme